MCAPSPPAPPDYTGAAVAQGTANKETAIAQSRLNNPNVYGPYGSQVWTEGTSAEDRPTLTQQLSPEQQALLEQSTATKKQLGALGQQGATALQGVVGKNLDLTGAPAVGGYDSTRARVLDAAMARTNEDYARQRDQANSELIAAGINPSNRAYADRMQAIERSRNDARNQAELTAGNATAQATAIDTQRRKDAIAEILAQRQTPLNEISALMSGSQVANPFATPGVAQNTAVGQTPIYDAFKQGASYGTDVYNSDVAAANSQTNAAAGLGTAALMAYAMF